MKNKDDKKPIPHGVITEMLGQASFSDYEELDVQTAEQIASTEYYSMKYLIEVIVGCIQDKKSLSNFMAFTRTFGSSTFYGPYMKSNP